MFIDQVHIRNFRSIVDQKFTAKDINVFVGNNDIGKSNLLKAMNLFFNGFTDYDTAFDFDKDYSFFAKKRAKTAREISISVRFMIPSNFKDSGQKVIWRKVWRTQGEYREKERMSGVSARSKAGNWIRKINFRYVPAIKSDSFFASLLQELYEVFSNTIQKELKANSKAFIGGIQKHTEPLQNELQTVLGIDSLLQLPENLSDLFLILDFLTKVDGTKKEISLKRRGDGVKVRHIPAILKFLADKERSHHIKGDVREDTIWGYEEPENNLELRAAFRLSESIVEYSKNIQMFITTHSPVFYKLGFETDRSLVHEVINAEEETKKITELKPVKDISAADEKMGLLPLVAPYVSKQEEKLRETKQKMDDLQRQLDATDQSAVLLVEGSHDKTILENAWAVLNPEGDAPFIIQDFFDCYAVGNLLGRGEVFKNSPDKTYIGLLDFDSAYECFERLAQQKSKNWVKSPATEAEGVALLHKQEKGALFLLPVPDHRAEYASEKYKKESCLSIELLFEDQVLKGYASKMEKVGGSSLFSIPDNKKSVFADKTAEFSEDDFKHFKPVFDRISNILQIMKERTS